MSSSSHPNRSLLRLAPLLMVGVLPASLQAETTVTPIGGEFPLSTISLPGTQSFPSVAISRSGGYVVWQDNTIDGLDLGIGLQKLNDQFQSIGTSVRVNAVTTGSQEKAQVIRWSNGSGAVVWQNNPAGGDTDIAARFLKADGSFVGGELRVNTVTLDVQNNPIALAHRDGSAWFAWSSYKQDGDLFGVYARRFSGTGAALATEFRVNEGTLFNQRTPAMAELPDGRVVFVWVSDRVQDNTGTASIFARIFSASGVPLTGDIRISENSSPIAANPSVASLPTGGFTVAWSYNRGPVFEEVVRNGSSERRLRSPNNFDIYYRRYSAEASPVGKEALLNTETFGDQLAPKIASFSGSQMVVWTSIGQDGSREGVFGRMILPDGTATGRDFQINTTTQNQQFHPNIASDGESRYLTVWSGFTQTSGGFELFGRPFESSVLHVAATPTATGAELVWQSRAGRRYQVQSSSDLRTWTNLGPSKTAESSETRLSLPGPFTTGFYRVVQLP